MSSTTVVNIDRSDSMLSLMGRALLSSSKKSSSLELPNVALKLDDQRIDKKHLKQYAKVCEFDISKGVPFTYPHMLAFPLHLQLMLRDDFPMAVMGLVHIKNTITQHKPISPSDSLSIECRFGGLEDHDKGKIINVITEVKRGQELVWESVSAMLKRMKTTDNPGDKTDKPNVSPINDSPQMWKLPGNLGRQYGTVSGDRNPIHLFALSAKLFGFKQQIAHGMWTKARCAAAVADAIGDKPATMEVEFKLPIFLPGKIGFYQAQNTNGLDLEVWNKTGTKPHLKATVTFNG